MEGETTMLGTPYDFQEPLNSSPSDYCAWKEGGSGLDLRLTLEPTATSSIDDHTGRGYNLDVDPVPVPQDGPGTSAVLLTDPAFADSGEENFAYGYFYVAGEVTVFLKSVGLDFGAERLRAMADETARRLGVRRPASATGPTKEPPADGRELNNSDPCRDSGETYVATHHNGGAEGIRTPDLLIANETRYQLRHSPRCDSG